MAAAPKAPDVVVPAAAPKPTPVQRDPLTVAPSTNGSGKVLINQDINLFVFFFSILIACVVNNTLTFFVMNQVF